MAMDATKHLRNLTELVRDAGVRSRGRGVREGGDDHNAASIGSYLLLL